MIEPEIQLRIEELVEANKRRSHDGFPTNPYDHQCAALEMLRIAAERAKEHGKAFDGIATEFGQEVIAYYITLGGNIVDVVRIARKRRDDPVIGEFLNQLKSTLY